MNLRSRLHVCLVGLVALTASCQKSKPPAEEVRPTDRVAPSPVGSSQSVLHKTFGVNATATFPFEVPAHASMPRLHGSYQSYAKQPGAHSNDDSANVDFLILNEAQYDDFSHGRPGEALFSADASHDQDVNVSLPPTRGDPGKYYLIFRNTPGGAAKKLVQADFTVDF